MKINYYENYKRGYRKRMDAGYKSFTVVGPIELIEAHKAFNKQYKKEHNLYIYNINNNKKTLPISIPIPISI